LAAKEATLLLNWAQKLEEGAGAADPATLRLLIEAAKAADKPALEKEALRKLIATDRGDLVAQVQYLDFLASGTQTVEERTRIYSNAAEQSSLDPQVRSEMAMRLSQLAQERGDRAGEKEYLERALVLNSVNVQALRTQVQLADANPRDVAARLSALVALVSANAYEPGAWAEIGHICREANLHDRAADSLGVALEEMQIAGARGDGQLYLDYAMELAIAGRRREAAAILSSLSNLADAPTPVLFAAQLLADVAPAGSTTAPGPVSERVQKAIETMAHDAESGKAPPTAWADAAGVALTVLNTGETATSSAQAAGWIDAYAKTVAADDPTLARLRGWQLYRAGKFDEARAALEKIAASDPLASIGLARLLIAQKKNDEAARQLQDVWASHPTGLLALQVAETARLGNLKLQDTYLTRQLGELVAKIPEQAYRAHRQPRELQLVNVEIDRATVTPGEPLIATVRIMNTAGRPLPVSAARTQTAGVVQTILGLTADVRVPEARSIGFYAMEDAGRVYRLEPRASIEMKFRLDQGLLATILASDPVRPATITIRGYTAPLVRADRSVTPGLGGQRLDMDDVPRLNFPMKNADEATKFLDELEKITSATSERSMAQILAAESVVEKMPQIAGLEMFSTRLVKDLATLAASQDGLVRAAVALGAPARNESLEKAIAPLASDPDPLVRACWARHAATGAKGGAVALGEQLRQVASGEKDEAVKEYMELLVTALVATTTQPQ
jgi:tetratricopeptide (TPR) repeat protein